MTQTAEQFAAKYRRNRIYTLNTDVREVDDLKALFKISQRHYGIPSLLDTPGSVPLSKSIMVSNGPAPFKDWYKVPCGNMDQLVVMMAGSLWTPPMTSSQEERNLLYYSTLWLPNILKIREATIHGLGFIVSVHDGGAIRSPPNFIWFENEADAVAAQFNSELDLV